MSELSDLLSSQQPEAFDSRLNHNEFPCVIISMINDNTSTVATRKLVNSINHTNSELQVLIQPATVPDTLEKDLKKFNLSLTDWKYPSEPGKQRNDLKSGLTLTGYNANNILKVISCMVSHMRLWRTCRNQNVPLVVLEHDAIFTKQFKSSDFPGEGGGIIGLNDPRGATRKSAVYYERISTSVSSDPNFSHIKDVPYVDDDYLAPQGLAGNSAYIIYPKAAAHMMNLVEEHGMWPNDALMCKQLVPYLKHTFPFYTGLQGVSSTTQG
jgi:GR25 family glycosyltransferase involved in LPS biosynthesis